VLNIGYKYKLEPLQRVLVLALDIRPICDKAC